MVAPDQGTRRRLPRVLPLPIRAAPGELFRDGQAAGLIASTMVDAGDASLDTHAAVLPIPRPVPRLRRRALVTGASGMLGSDLVPLLSVAGYEVFARSKQVLDITDEGAVA